MKHIARLILTTAASQAGADTSDYDRGFNAGFKAGYDQGVIDGHGQGVQSVRDGTATIGGSKLSEGMSSGILPPRDMGKPLERTDEGRFPSFGNGVLDNATRIPQLLE